MALWPAAMCAAPTGRIHGRTNQQLQKLKKTLANGEPSIHGARTLAAALAVGTSPNSIISIPRLTSLASTN